MFVCLFCVLITDSGSVDCELVDSPRLPGNTRQSELPREAIRFAVVAEARSTYCDNGCLLRDYGKVVLPSRGAWEHVLRNNAGSGGL